LPSTEQGALRALLIQVSALPLILQIAKWSIHFLVLESA
jgi:hypothetical protein